MTNRHEIDPVFSIIPLEVSQPLARRSAYTGIYEVILNDRLRVAIITQDEAGKQDQAAVNHVLKSPLYPYVVMPEQTAHQAASISTDLSAEKPIIYLSAEGAAQLAKEIQVVVAEVPYMHSTVLLSQWEDRARVLTDTIFRSLIETGLIRDEHQSVLRQKS